MIKLQIQTHSLCFTCTHELQIQTHSLYWTSYKKKERKLVTAIILLWTLQLWIIDLVKVPTEGKHMHDDKRQKFFSDPNRNEHFV